MDELVHQIRGLLSREGISCDPGSTAVLGRGPLKVVCLSGRLGASIDEVKTRPRDQVVMVRVDEGTLDQLDAWVETGVVKSRSEAAALFISEGLKVRESELSDLRGAIDAVRKAKDDLREAASRVLGEENDE